jgi:tetratricopeptide (TPR) repeat protein
MYLGNYDRGAAATKRLGMKERKIPSYSPMSYLLTKDDEGVKEGTGVRLKRGFRENTYPIIITDFDLARQALVKKFDAEVPAVLEILKKGEETDPDNALYNYLRAYLYFVLDEKDKAFREIRKGVNKRYLNNYVKECIEAREQVAQKVDFSNDVIKKLLGSHVFANFMVQDLCIPYIYKYAEQYKQQGELEEAQEKYAMLIGIANHIREEPVPTESRREFNGNVALNLEEKAVSAIREVSQNSEK